MIYTVTLNPALDKTVSVNELRPGRLNRITEKNSRAGGKGINVSKILQVLGTDNTALAVVGGATGAELEKDCLQIGLSSRFWHCEGETRCNIKIVDMACHKTTELNEPGPAVPDETLNGMLQYLYDSCGEKDIVVLSGSLPPNVPFELYGDWISKLRQRKVRVYLDACGPALQSGLAMGPRLIKPNREELEAVVGRRLSTQAQLLDAGKQLLRSGPERVVVSLGDEGALFFFGSSTYFAPCLEGSVRCTVGAGDAMVAALACCEEKRLDDEQTVRLSMAAAASVVMCGGPGGPGREDILALAEKAVVQAF